MKRFILAIICVASFSFAIAAPELNYVEASDLSLLGKMCPTTNPYHRLDVDKYPEFTNKPVAVYYGDVEAPDCKDKLYGAYNIFDRGRKK